MYTQYEKGRLWYPGTAGEQPARYLRSMEILDSEVSKVRAEREAERIKTASSGSAAHDGGGSLIQRTVIRSPEEARRVLLR